MTDQPGWACRKHGERGCTDCHPDVIVANRRHPDPCPRCESRNRSAEGQCFAKECFPPRSNQPETITVPVEVLRRLHGQAVSDAWDDCVEDVISGTNLAWWPTFLARLREQAQ